MIYAQTNIPYKFNVCTERVNISLLEKETSDNIHQIHILLLTYISIHHIRTEITKNIPTLP